MSQAEKATALVLRFIDFSESSGVATLFTREFGKIGGLAKGARKPKGPSNPPLDLLSLCRVVFLRKSSGTLDLLTEAKLERRFRPLGRGLGRLYAGYYVAELLTVATDEHDPHPDLFDLADETLRALARIEQGSPAAWTVRFELGLLRVLGHVPAFVGCAECGAEMPRTGRIAFGARSGGALCSTCRVGKRNLVSLRAETAYTLQRFVDAGDPDHPESTTWTTLTLPQAERGEIRGLLNNYLTELIGDRPRLMDHLAAIGHGEAQVVGEPQKSSEAKPKDEASTVAIDTPVVPATPHDIITQDQTPP